MAFVTRRCSQLMTNGQFVLNSRVREIYFVLKWFYLHVYGEYIIIIFPNTCTCFNFACLSFTSSIAESIQQSGGQFSGLQGCRFLVRFFLVNSSSPFFTGPIAPVTTGLDSAFIPVLLMISLSRCLYLDSFLTILLRCY